VVLKLSRAGEDLDSEGSTPYLPMEMVARSMYPCLNNIRPSNRKRNEMNPDLGSSLLISSSSNWLICYWESRYARGHWPCAAVEFVGA